MAGYLGMFTTTRFADADSAVNKPNLHEPVNSPNLPQIRTARIPPGNVIVDLDGSSASAMYPTEAVQTVQHSGSNARNIIATMNGKKGTKGDLVKYYINPTASATVDARLIDVRIISETYARLEGSTAVFNVEYVFKLYEILN